MTSVRRQILARPVLAALLLAATLLLRVLVPAGYMPDVSAGRMTIALCTGHGPARMAVAMPGMAHHGEGQHPSGADGPCAFAGLSAPGLAGADPIQIALAIAFVVAIVRVATAFFRVADADRLRPPSRGPPATA